MRRPSAVAAAAARGDLPSCSSRCSSIDASTASSFSVLSGFRLERHPSPLKPSTDDWLSSTSAPQVAATAAPRPRLAPASRRPSPLVAFASLSVSAATATHPGVAASTAEAPLLASTLTTAALPGGKKSKKSKRTSEEAPAAAAAASSRAPLNYLRHLAAGAASCAVSRTTLAPLERMKLEQVLHGASGCSIGETAGRVWRSGVAAAAAASASPPGGGGGGGGGAPPAPAAAAAAASRVLGGVSAFWRGNGVNLLRTCPHKALNFFAFDTYRSALLTARRARGRRERAERRRRRSTAAAATAAPAAAALEGGDDERPPPPPPPLQQRQRQQRQQQQQEPRRLRLPAISLFAAKRDSRKQQTHHRHHIHGGSPAPTTALFEDSDSDSEREEFGAAERFAAGAMAGATATAICFPLDVLRTRVLLAAPSASAAAATMASSAAARPAALAATLRSIVAVEGVGALYSGLAPALAATGPSGAIFYGTYDVLKHLVLRSMERREQEEEEKEEEKRREEEARRGGVRVFRRRGGHSSSSPFSSSSSSRSPSFSREPPRMSARATLACGAAAGAAAELAVYPMEVVRRRMQVAAMQLAAASGGAGAASSSSLAALAGATSFRGAAASLVRERGVAGLYAGLGPTMLQVLPSAALSYYAYEVFKARFGVVGGVQ